MAGERIGKTYEAVLKIVLERLKRKGIFTGSIFWNETPNAFTVEPDFIIGPSINEPMYLVLSTHIGSAKDSEKKCWRNLGELCEAKAICCGRIFAINIIFDSVMKAAFKQIQEKAFDAQLIVGDQEYGRVFQEWVSEHSNQFPSEQNAKKVALEKALESDDYFHSLFTKLQDDVERCFAKHTGKDPLQKLWDLDNAREKSKTPQVARNTFFRRGFAKRLLIGDSFHGERVDSNDGKWLSTLGIAKETTIRSQYRIVDTELIWFSKTRWESRYKDIAAPCESEGFLQQIEKVRSFAVIDAFSKYVIDNYSSLITTEGMLRCITQQAYDPVKYIDIPTSVKAPENIWIYDYIAALSKAVSGKSQSFGYSSFASHKEGNSFSIGNMSVGEWCNCFINQYFARKGSFSPDERTLRFVAKVLSEQLASINIDICVNKRNEILEQYISKEYEVTLLSHSGFEPLLALLIDEGIIGSKDDKLSIRTCFAEKAQLGGKSGKVTVVQIKNTLIGWKSAYAGHPADKRKELAGRAIGLRYTWDQTASEFKPRPGVSKLILLLDGTWSQSHLMTLINAGWDEIFYPDEIDKLKAAIV